MSRNTAEYGQKSEEEYQAKHPATERALEFINRNDPELMETLMAHAKKGVHHSEAAWTNEAATLSYDYQGAAIEVVNRECTASRLLEAMKETVAADGSSLRDTQEAAGELVHMMTTPYREGLEALPPERERLRQRLEMNLSMISEEAGLLLTREAADRIPAEQQFCEKTEEFGRTSRDLEHALDGKPDFDAVMEERDSALQEQLKHRDGPPDIFPLDGEPNPRAEALLGAYSDTIKEWSWDYRQSVLRDITDGATSWIKDRLEAQEEMLRETGRFEEARDVAQLTHEVDMAKAEMAEGLFEIYRRGTHSNGADRFHRALERIAEVELNPEKILASGH